MFKMFKKGEGGDAWSFLIRGLLFSIISLIFLLVLFSFTAKNADIESSLAICKASVIMSEKVTDKTRAGGIDWLSWGNMCKTHEIVIPEKDSFMAYEMTKEDAIRNIADRIASCWNQFGEGLIARDVFGQADFESFSKERCMVCFSFTIDNLPNGEKIDVNEIIEYMASNPYTVRGTDIDLCTKDNKENCVEKTDSMCVRKGGTCEEACDVAYSSPYNDWTCHGRNEQCCVNKEDFVSYTEYVYMYKGPGLFMFSEDISFLERNTEYAISFVSDTSFANNQGAMKVFLTGTTLGAAGVTTALITGIAFASNPVGWVVGGSIAIGAASTALYTGQGFLFNHFSKDPQTILITPSSMVEDQCIVMTGVDGR